MPTQDCRRCETATACRGLLRYRRISMALRPRAQPARQRQSGELPQPARELFAHGGEMTRRTQIPTQGSRSGEAWQEDIALHFECDSKIRRWPIRGQRAEWWAPLRLPAA